MNRDELKLNDEQYLMPCCHHRPLLLDRGEGSYLFDALGNEFLDFSSSMGEGCIGQGHSQWIEAVMDQALQLSIASAQTCTQPATRLAEELCHRSGMASACFVSSGVEAQRLLIRLARTYSQSRYSSERSVILSLQGANRPLTDGILPVLADMEDIRAKSSHEVCAILLELLPQGGSMNPLPRKFVHELAILCAEQDWLLLIDERYTGAGRSGSLFAFLQYGILPDALCFSSAMSGGLPLGGILTSNRCRAVLDLDVQTEFALGANPVCAAAALSVLEILNEDRLAQAKEKGEYLRAGIESLHLPALDRVHGAGLMLGVGVSPLYSPETLAERLLEHGLLCIASAEGLLFLPPLTVTMEELDRALAILKQALGEGEETT